MEFYDSPVPVMLALILLAAWGFWLLFRRQQVTAQLAAQRTDSFTRVLERFASVAEFLAFIESEQGRALFDISPPRKPSRPLWTVIRTLQLGTLLIFISVVFFIDAFAFRTGTDLNDVMGRQESLQLGVFFVACGVGLFAAAGIGAYFARRWGLVERLESESVARR